MSSVDVSARAMMPLRNGALIVHAELAGFHPCRINCDQQGNVIDSALYMSP